MKKPSLSSQDVRNKILQLRDSLVLNLEFIQEAVDRDLEFLQAYYRRFGDLNYRPVIGRDIDQKPNYGERTELMIEPVASKYRATIKSLLDSVRLIESEILPEDNPEGSTAASNSDPATVSSKRASLRAEFSANAGQSGKAIEPEQDDTEEEVEEANAVQAIPPTKLVEKPKSPTKRTHKPAVESPKSPEPDSIPKGEERSEPSTPHRPWRVKPQAVVVEERRDTSPQAEPVEEKSVEKKELMNPSKLDPETERLRAEFMSLRGGSKMASLMGKYGKKKTETDGDDESDE